MIREVITTADGSTTIHIPAWNEHYHSKHGALTEAKHVFIQAGLYHWLSKNKLNEVYILEIGFGTGLNAFLTLLEAKNLQQHIKYTGVEAFPILTAELQKLNYAKVLDTSPNNFNALHAAIWEENELINPYFEILKQKKLFSEIENEKDFDIIYFDAFGIRVQPELWTIDIFSKMYNSLKNNGILVTYAANGNARRALQHVGFVVEKLAGPPGKREMLRATKFI